MMGAPQKFPQASTGQAYVFLRDDAGTPLDPFDDIWTEHAKLLPVDGEVYDDFGISVALTSNTLLVGADRNNAGFIGPGIVMCGIQLAGGEWLLGAEITARYGGGWAPGNRRRTSPG